MTNAPPAFVPPTPSNPLHSTKTPKPTPNNAATLRLHTATAPLLHPRPSVHLHPTPTLHPTLSPQPYTSLPHSDNSLAKPTGTILVLFRSDLRLDDHPALSHALQEASHVIPVYCFDPRHFGRTDYGFEKTGRYRAQFLLESVQDLRASLRERGSDLIVRMGEPEKVLLELAKKTRAKEVFMHRGVTFEEQSVEIEVEKALQGKASLKLMWANTLYHEDDLPFDVSQMPDVYSDFRERVEKEGTIRTPLLAPKEMPAVNKAVQVGEIPTLGRLGISETPVETRCDVQGVGGVKGGENEAMKRVRAYVEDSKKLSTQGGPRASVTAHLGADFSCRISPWLALGCISPRRIFAEMKKSVMDVAVLLKSSTYYELVWRDFFRCITAKYSSRRSKAATKASPKVKSMVRA
eukprot:GFKZ01016032.1.p1 GENE.GFKZ01016032.1~~GFKZ01016032.1.p1  ORF type:complete len:406 (-),score=61.97 GFKZ01016032.1:1814-3031(-)